MRSLITQKWMEEEAHNEMSMKEYVFGLVCGSMRKYVYNKQHRYTTRKKQQIDTQIGASMEVLYFSVTLDDSLSLPLFTTLGQSFYTRALIVGRVHTCMDTKWKELAFYANKLPCKRTTLSYVYK